jgi:antitoxin (DNA-binding transcriptional repressor) of toxin-antitoxin stability system
MRKKVFHVSESEAASDFGALLARVRAGAEVVIASGGRAVAVLRAVGPVRRTISQCIELAKAHQEASGNAPVLDVDFAEDVEAAIEGHREPLEPPAWD